MISLHWHFDPSVVLGLGGLTIAYLAGVGPLRRRYGWADRVERGQVFSFLLGVLVIYLAVGSPLHDLAELYLFSAHMVQHQILVLIAPPLLLAGTPGWLLRPLLRWSGGLAVARLFTKAAIAGGMFNVVFALWHYPPFYDIALRDHNIHIVEHLMFMSVAVLLWWPVLSPLSELPRLPLVGQTVYLLAQMLPCNAVGAMITLSSEVLYPWYAEAPRVWGLSPIVDQQIGGVIMWGGGNLFFMVTAVVVFFIWAGQEEQEYGRASAPSR